MSFLELDIPGRRALVALSSGVVHSTQGRIGAEDIGMPNWFARYRLRPADIAGGVGGLGTVMPPDDPRFLADADWMQTLCAGETPLPTTRVAGDPPLCPEPRGYMKKIRRDDCYYYECATFPSGAEPTDCARAGGYGLPYQSWPRGGDVPSTWGCDYTRFYETAQAPRTAPRPATERAVVTDWATRPCSRKLPPSCVGRMKVRNKVLRDCYDWVCPSTPATLYAEDAAIRAEYAAQAAAAELAALRRRRELLLAAQAAGTTSLPPMLIAPPALIAPPPTIDVGDPYRPPLTQRLRRRPPAFDTNNLIWLMAGAVAVMALRR